MKEESIFIYKSWYMWKGRLHVFYIGKGATPSFNALTLESEEYHTIKKKFNNKINLFSFDIIDSVNKSEAKFWVDHYLDLYKSWGFDIAPTCFVNRYDFFKIKFVNNVGDQLTKSSDAIETNYSINKEKFIFLLINDMFENKGINQTFDEVLLYLILIMLEGPAPYYLENLSFIELKNIFEKANAGEDQKYFHRIVYFLYDYQFKYELKHDRGLGKVFSKVHEYNLNQCVNKLFNYFGYNVGEFEIENSNIHSNYINWINFQKLKDKNTNPFKVITKRKYYSSSKVHNISYDIMGYISMMTKH